MTFFANSFEFFYIENHFICKQGQFYLFVPNLYTFDFPFITALARISSTVLKRRSEGGFLALQLTLVEKHLVCHHCMILALGLLFIKLVKFRSIPSLLRFYY